MGIVVKNNIRADNKINDNNTYLPNCILSNILMNIDICMHELISIYLNFFLVAQNYMGHILQ